MSKPKIVMIGAGNVASHLAPALSDAGAADFVQVYSRHIESARELAAKLPGASATANLNDIVDDADIYLLSVKDDAIAGIAAALPKGNALVLHTSGSVGMEALSTASDRYGVFYPLQTFSKNVDLDMPAVPLFVEGNTPETEAEIRTLGEKVFRKVYHADSEIRKKMHVSAVFACNFTNHLWTIAEKLLQREGLPFDVLRPLLEETLRKALVNSPSASQTGPAVRGDVNIIASHLAQLSDPEKSLYSTLSDAIMTEKIENL